MKDRHNVISASKTLKLSILTLLTLLTFALFFGGILSANAQNVSVNSAKQKISQSWQDIKGELADIQVRKIMAGIKEEWQKEIIEMKQDIAELWHKYKERIRLWKTP
ncbi:MAG: hypothetical protein AAB620_00530 [Patescibacteria group bacterium]